MSAKQKKKIRIEEMYAYDGILHRVIRDLVTGDAHTSIDRIEGHHDWHDHTGDDLRRIHEAGSLTEEEYTALRQYMGIGLETVEEANLWMGGHYPEPDWLVEVSERNYAFTN